jgi:hypothetical protein
MPFTGSCSAGIRARSRPKSAGYSTVPATCPASWPSSPIEYVAFFGTPIGATGFSGRYGHADVWDLMVQGRMLTYTPGQFEATEYGPGDPAFLPKGTVKTMAYVGSTWMIDYGRGLPVTMMPFGITGPAAFATLDIRSAGEQLADYGKLVLRGMFKNH